MRTFPMLGMGALLSRAPLFLGLVVSATMGIAAAELVAAQSKKSPSDSPKEFVFLLPDGFRGWVCVDFAVAGAPPLPREGNALVIRPHQGEVLATSDKAETPNLLTLYGAAWYEANGERRPLPSDVILQPGPSRYGSNEPTQRRCAFVGTTDEKEAVGDRAPGFENLARDRRAIPVDERRALEALYKATDGDHWTHRVGWLGPEGTECNWHGIGCATPDNSDHVTDVALPDNNLSGAIPEALAGLTHLESISIHDNHLSGKLPDALVQKWLSGSLSIAADPSAFTDVSEVDFESRSSSVLCARDRIILRSDGIATLFIEKCRKRTPQDRATFCEVKEGHVLGSQFGTLSVLLEKNGFYSLRRKYSRSVTDSGLASLRVIRGKTNEVVEYAGGSPYELWIINGFIAGLEVSINWESTNSIPKCPQWENGRVP